MIKNVLLNFSNTKLTDSDSVSYFDEKAEFGKITAHIRHKMICRLVIQMIARLKAEKNIFLRFSALYTKRAFKKMISIYVFYSKLLRIILYYK